MRLRTAKGFMVATLIAVQLPIRAQEARGTILGRVMDQSGGVIAGALVEVQNTETSVRLSAATNQSGDFLFPFLIPGPYSLTAEASGFKKSVRPSIVVRVNERIAIDVTMEIGATAESVQVVAETPLLDTSTGLRG